MGIIRKLGMATAIAAMAVGTVQAQAQTSPQPLDIRPGELKQALDDYARQTGINVVYRDDDLRGQTSRGVKGRLSAADGLDALLAGTALVAIRSATGVAVVKRDDAGAAGNAEDAQIVVIGTNIRGATQGSSPSRQFDRGDIQRSGARTTQEFVQNLPQNFAGGSNDALVRGSPKNPSAASNLSLGSSVNLRGLGSGATLVLIDGQRLAPSSNIGDFVDISMLPLNAVSRVQILTDGASAIYGGDAVAGVVNFELRDSFEGAETFASYGNVTEGRSAEYRAGQTIGADWGSGSAIATYDFYRRNRLSVLDKDFSRPIGRPIDLLPRQIRHAAMVGVSQDVGPDLRLWGRLLYGQRDAQVVRSNTATVATRVTDADTDQITGMGGLRGKMWPGWSFDLSGVYSKVRSASSTPAVAGAGTASSRESFSTLYGGEAKASGPLFSMPGGDVDVAMGYGFREERFSTTNRLTGINDRRAGRSVMYGFGELLLPIFGAGNAVPGFQRLEINMSGRLEGYSDFGSTFNPKIGLLWSPIKDVNLRASYGTSFNPPDLGVLNARDMQANYFTNDILNALLVQNPEIPDGRTALLVLGTAANLHEETSKNWTVGLDMSTEVAGGRFTFNGTYYDTRFRDRIAQIDVPGGGFNIFNIYLSSPDQLPAGTVIENPSAAQVNEILTRSLSQGGVFNNFGVPTSNVGLIAFIQTINVARTITRGIDVDLGFGFDPGIGPINLSLNGNYILDFKSQSSTATPLFENVDLIFRPAEFRLRGGANWSRNGWGANLYVNYTDSYKDDRPAVRVKIPSFTTVDLFLSYETGRGRGPLDGLRIDLGIDNLFNREPPFIGNDFQFGILGYDPANADPVGRFVSLKVTKKW